MKLVVLVLFLFLFWGLRETYEHFNYEDNTLERNVRIPKYEDEITKNTQLSTEETSDDTLSNNDDTSNNQVKTDTSNCGSTFDTHGGIIVYCLIVLYCFVGLAVLCEGEFKDSIVKLSKVLRLSPDVAGATLMAAGTSSPELFTALVAIFGPSEDIGSGTIVGSAIFNILIIIGSCAIFSSFTFNLDWKSITRDSAINIVAFTYLYLAFFDEKIVLVEALIGCGLYIAYVLAMAFNDKVMYIMTACGKKSNALLPFGKYLCPEDSGSDESYGDDENGGGGEEEDGNKLLDEDEEFDEEMLKYNIPLTELNSEDPPSPNTSSPDIKSGDVEDEFNQIVASRYEKDHNNQSQNSHQRHHNNNIDGGDSNEDLSNIPNESENKNEDVDDDSNDVELVLGGERDQSVEDFEVMMKKKMKSKRDASFEEPSSTPHSIFHKPKTIKGWIWYITSLPFELAFLFTIPRVNGRFKYQYILSFILSLCWLATLSIIMVKSAEKVGCILHIDDAVMGITILAVGTSLPDCLASIAVAKTGRGNMAVCNALGSNIFDILIALCLPWTISIIMYRQPIAVTSETLNEDTVILFGTLFLFYFGLVICKWKLGNRLGYFLIVVYFFFIAYTIMRQMGLVVLLRNYLSS